MLVNASIAWSTVAASPADAAPVNFEAIYAQRKQREAQEQGEQGEQATQ